MALFDLTDLETTLPDQLVADSSILLALRPGDDNPHAVAAYRFIERVGQRILNRQAVLWLPVTVLQECYHVVLSQTLRRLWSQMPAANRPPNWLAAYKQQPNLLAAGFDDLTAFDETLAAIPVTPAYLAGKPSSKLLVERMHHFVTAYHLLPQDALILAETDALGVTAVVTLDSDWRRAAPEFDVYTIL